MIPRPLVEQEKYEVLLQAYPVFELNFVSEKFTTHGEHLVCIILGFIKQIIVCEQ